jgi:hypothetical protein
VQEQSLPFNFAEAKEAMAVQRWWINMRWARFAIYSLAATFIIVPLMLPSEAAADPARRASQVGTLVCAMGPRVGLLVGSRQRLKCQYTQVRSGRVENYSGRITRFGLDLGVTVRGIMRWRVLARTRGQQNGALSGQYVGASGDVSLGVGIGGKFLIGGTRRSIMLQPVSVVGKVGVNLAVGVTGLNLRFTGSTVAASILVPTTRLRTQGSGGLALQSAEASAKRKVGTRSDKLGPA